MSCQLLGYLFPGMGNCFSSVSKSIGHSFRLPEKNPDAQQPEAKQPQQQQQQPPQQGASGNERTEPRNDTATKPPTPVKKLRKTQSVLTANILGRETPDVRSLYNIGRELGRGQFGVTYLCTDKVTGEQYACKSIAKRKLVQEEDVEDVRREVAIMHHLAGSPNIVTMKGAFEDRQSVHIVMELCAGGELFDRIVSKGHYSEKAAASLIRTIVQVVETCHSHGVIHRDLKPENFLLLNESEDSPLKATDFGLSVFFKPGEQFSDIVGSAYYVAPEVLLRRYGQEVDIWSCGVMLYILLSGVPPFWAETERGIFEAVSKGYVDFVSDPWPSISKEAKELVKKMLTLDTSLRLTASQVLSHPWVRIDGSAPDKPLDTAILTRLKQFSAMNKLKKIALRVIARNMSPEEIQGLKMMFKSMDDDGSGTITFEELKAGLAKGGSNMPEDQIRELMDAADLDQNGTIDLDEFITATINLYKAQKEENLIEAFKHFDSDNSGFITKEELKSALSNEALQPGEIESIIREVDSDNDGRIDYEEFAAMFRKPQKLSPERAVSRMKSSKNPYDFFVAPAKN